MAAFNVYLFEFEKQQCCFQVTLPSPCHSVSLNDVNQVPTLIKPNFGTVLGRTYNTDTAYYVSLRDTLLSTLHTTFT